MVGSSPPRTAVGRPDRRGRGAAVGAAACGCGDGEPEAVGAGGVLPPSGAARVDVGALLTTWQVGGRRGGWRPFLHHISKNQPQARRTIAVKAPKKLPQVVTVAEMQVILDACEHLRDRQQRENRPAPEDLRDQFPEVPRQRQDSRRSAKAG